MHLIIKKLSLLFITVAAVNQAPAQTPSRSYTGEIIFTEKQVSADSLNAHHILRKTTMTNKTNLFMAVFLKRTLSSYLHELAPSLSLDSLSKIGNYQFSFMVDDRLIYRTELMPGAPRPAQQQKDTIWSKPLIDNQHEGAWWSQSAWNRFMYNGGDSALTEGPHTLKLILRPYVKTPDLIAGEIIAQGQLDLIVKRKPELDLQSIVLSPPKPYAGLEVSVEPYDRNRIKVLKASVEADVFRHITSIVALKNGKILFEEYFNGSARDSLHDVRSVGKSYASTLTGIAIKDGYLKSTAQTLGDFYELKDYQHYSPAKAKVTIKELLTMSSRFDGDDDDSDSPGNEENMYPTADWVKFTLDLPLDTVKYNGQWHYFTAGTILAGSILNKVVAGGLETYADKKLFRPLAITNYRWVYTPQNAPSTAGGIRMNALDFAKYGQLYANQGRWKGKQIVPEKWVKESLSHQIALTDRKDEYYGYLFWNKTYHSAGKAYEVYYCSGNGGNKIFIFKDIPLVVVITATAYGNGYAHRQADQIMEDFVLPAVLAGDSK